MRRLLVAFILTLFVVSQAQAAEIISGQVVGVHDGDTLTLLTKDKRQVKIRLSEIDAPEIGQPYGDKSKKTLSDLAFQRSCDATVVTTDKYKRKVASVTCDGKNVNREMVRAGAAWVYDEYSHSMIIELDENQAQNANRGLWALQDDQRIEPWRWRKGEHAPLKPEPKEEFSCNSKKYLCSQMRSCQEAKFYLDKCGEKALDLDYDGTPCEKLCGS